MAGKRRRKTSRSNVRGNSLSPVQRKFLATYAETGVLAKACEAAERDRRTHYRWLEESEVYVKAFEDAEEEAADRLEAEARRRAHDGIDNPVFYKGEVVGAIREYSDTLMVMLLKGARPEKYRERYDHEHSGKGGGPISVATLQGIVAEVEGA